MNPIAPAAAPPSLPAEARLVFNEDDFQHASQLIYKRAGIHLGAGKQAMVYSRLLPRLRANGHANFSAYLHWLQGNATPQAQAEWQEFVNALTTNLTSFFREEHHFELLSAQLIAMAGMKLRLWCNAASTGEEPYSLAMVVHETMGPDAQAELLASDIDTKVLATARRGVYSTDSRGLNAERRHRFFMRGSGSNEGFIRIKPELARRLKFFEFNLMSEDWSALGEPFDVVFCRNVMIYFDTATQHKVLRQMHRVIRPGGLLYLGHSESFNDLRDLYKMRGRTVYERL